MSLLQRSVRAAQDLLQYLLNGRSERVRVAKCRCMYLK